MLARRLGACIWFVFVCALGWQALAQAATHPTAAPVAVTLGQSLVPLNGPWKFTVGDSPVDPATRQPLWAEPDFDDSRWETVDLTPAHGASEPINGLSGYVPGWTARGHAGYWGYAWYRIRLQVKARTGERLALQGPNDFDEVFQVFANGKLVGGFGDFSGGTPVEYYSQPVLLPLSGRNGSVSESGGGMARGDAAQGGYSSSSQVLAFRVWMSPEALTSQPDAGGLHNAPVLGEAGAAAAGNQLRWLDLIRVFLPTVVLGLLCILLSVVAFSLVLFDRSDQVYVWIGAVFLLNAISDGLVVVGGFTQFMSVQAIGLLRDCLAIPAIYAGWVMVWWVWFGRPRPRWTPIAAAGLALLLAVSTAVGHELFFGMVPHPVAADFEVVSLVLRVLFFALLLWIVVWAIRQQGLEGWLVLPAVLLRGIATFSRELLLLHIRLNLHPLGVTVNLLGMANVLLVAALALLLLRRLFKSVKRQRLLALDVKQAQEVQRVILPEAQIFYPGLAIESVYRPASEVGGDFFQIIPHASDGSLLIVAGDVAGKGLPAGMLVALLVGAVRTAADTSADPEQILRVLNKRLVGRGDAAATCLALHIDAQGEATLANAGHVPPYLNGEPVAMEGALPLGMIAGAESSVMRFRLEQGDRLMLMSDGILEAMDAEKRLFGFERIHELLQSRISAREVADAAQKFGQEDDISVISVTRMAALEAALA